MVKYWPRVWYYIKVLLTLLTAMIFVEYCTLSISQRSTWKIKSIQIDIAIKNDWFLEVLTNLGVEYLRFKAKGKAEISIKLVSSCQYSASSILRAQLTICDIFKAVLEKPKNIILHFVIRCSRKLIFMKGARRCH